VPDDSSKNGLVKLGSASLTHYSNAIVRRAIESLASRSAAVVRPPTRKYSVLLVTRDETLALHLRTALENPDLHILNEQIELRVIESALGYEAVLSDLSKEQTDMVVITDTGIQWKEVCRLAGHITIHYPHKIIFVLSRYCEDEYVAGLYSFGIDAFLKLPHDINELAEVINARLCWGIAVEGRVNLLLPFYHFTDEMSIFDDMGFLTIHSNDSEKLIENLQMWQVDIAIEWQHSENDFPVRDFLRKEGKNVPVFLCDNLGKLIPTNASEAGYMDTLIVPFQAKEIKEKFFRVLPRIKRAIFEKTIRTS
jgi:hypothetical protein